MKLSRNCWMHRYNRQKEVSFKEIEKGTEVSRTNKKVEQNYPPEKFEVVTKNSRYRTIVNHTFVE